MLQNNAASRGSGKVRYGRLVWEFEAKPTPLSRTYRLRIEYQEGSVPKVVVVDPDLRQLADGRILPHVYEQHPTQLCLYFPKTGEWSSGKLIATSIVPWAYLWLFYFEEWLISNEWKGGGEHPKMNNDNERKTNSND